MNPSLRIATAMVAGLTGLTAIVLILWPSWIVGLRAEEWRMPWQTSPWRPVLVDGLGNVSAPIQNGFLLLAVTLLLALALIIACLDIITAPASETVAPILANPPQATNVTSEPAVPVDATGNDAAVLAEIARIVALLRSYLEVNGLYDTALAKASAQLPGAARPDQIRVIVSYLMVENDNMRNRTRDLQASLEQSRRQIENLKSNLAVAKAEGISDALTSLRNRRGFDLVLAAEAANARSAAQSLSLVMADIDHFKTVNDRLGHQTGDEVLRWFAALLSANMKGRDTVARYGGEEFGIILPQTSFENAVSLAGQIRAQLETNAWTSAANPKQSLNITASFGVASLRSGETTDSLLRRTDAKLYEAKQAGRNKVAS
ncbi:MAG: GGDEF domain-containing protein [Rhizobiales bacterium]|nr:GGDEF domain-containing protein [Hyphomicrobiales bacterium]MBI3673400.1 GGDEF domain-containing protein [Hyphomicrobiales bacterium]